MFDLNLRFPVSAAFDDLWMNIMGAKNVGDMS